MEKRRAFLINFTYFAVIAALAFVLLRYGVSMLAPFVIAFVIAYLLKAPISFLSRKLKLSRRLAAILAVLLFYVTIGSLIGLLFWFSRRTALVAEPWLVVLNALPKLALAPVLVIWFGIGFSSKVILAFLMTVVVAACCMAAFGLSFLLPKSMTRLGKEDAAP